MTAATTRDVDGATARNRNSFDAIRMFAASCVFFSHQIGMAGRIEPVLGPSGISLASTGLYIFFALSGYLIFMSLARDPRGSRFVTARLLRIYPGSVVSVLFCVALGASLSTLPLFEFWRSPMTWSYLAHNVAIVVTPTKLMLPGVFENARWPVVNGSIWTIKYELLCYLVIWCIDRLVLSCAVLRRGALLVMTIALIGGYVYQTSFYSLPKGNLFFVGFNTFNLLRFFMVFCAGASYAASEPLGERVRMTFLAVPGTLIVFGPTPAFAKAGVILFLTLLAIEVGRTPVFFSRIYRGLGDLSYGTFLYAYPIQNLITTRFYDGHNFATVTLMSFAVVLFCAFLSWHLVEKPALAVKDGIDSRRLSPTSTSPSCAACR